MRRLLPRLAFPLALFATVLTGTAQPAPPATAGSVMARAKAEAIAEHKNILLVFSASWCGPCHMFEGFLDDESTGPILRKAFVFGRLDVGENPSDKRHADTPGGVDLRASLGGKDAGYPYIVMVDPATGKPLADSLRPTSKGKENIGYPDSAAEIAWFMTMLQKSAPGLTPADTLTLRNWLKAHSHSV